MKKHIKEKDRSFGIADLLAMLLSFVLRLVFVPKCVICGELLSDGGEMCPDCLRHWDSARREKCSVCRKSARACTCRPVSMSSTDEIGERSLLSLTFYSGAKDKVQPRDVAASRIVWAVKTSSDRSAVRFVARELAGDLLRLFTTCGEKPSDWRITFPPRTASRRRHFGFDQGRDMAKMLSEYTGIPTERCFVNRGNTVQKALNSAERRRNAEGAYKLNSKAAVKNKKYIIADDVITTGATISACASLLKDAGADCVFPVSIARTKRKKRNVRRASERPWFKFDTKP